MSGSKIKVSEAEVVRDCKMLLELNHIPHFRNNVLNGKFQGHGEKRWRHVVSGTPGLSDWSVMLDDGKTLYLEIKAPGKKQSQGQKDFEAECVKRGAPYLVVYCWQDLAEFLDAYDMLKVRM